VATIRNARGGVHPDPLKAAQIAVEKQPVIAENSDAFYL